MLSTSPEDAHVFLNEVGAEAAIYVALLPLGIAVLLLLFRYG